MSKAFWQQLHLYTHSTDVESISDWLIEEGGAISVVLQDAGNETLCDVEVESALIWKEVHLTGVFEKFHDLQGILKELQLQYGDGILKNHYIDTYDDQDWESLWRSGFQPLQFGKNLWVCQSWHTPPDPKAINIILDPGMAFGTGTHATTALCLKWLADHDLQGKTVVDYGCGSGILALAALKLGAKHVFAIDHDKQALDVARANAESNQVNGDSLEIIHSSDEVFKDSMTQNKADILIANILAKPLINLAPYLAECIHQEGHLILSGILETQVEEVSRVYQANGFILRNKEIAEEWARLDFSAP